MKIKEAANQLAQDSNKLTQAEESKQSFKNQIKELHEDFIEAQKLFEEKRRLYQEIISKYEQIDRIIAEAYFIKKQKEVQVKVKQSVSKQSIELKAKKALENLPPEIAKQVIHNFKEAESYENY